MIGPHRVRGNTYHNKKDYDRAITDYTKAIEIDPKDANYYNGRAWAYFRASKAAVAMNRALLKEGWSRIPH